MKGISPIISSVILIMIILMLAAFVGPWMISLTQNVAEEEGNRIDLELICRQTSYDFDSSYGNSGFTWNFTNTTGVMSTKITNTGSRNIYNFTFEVIFDTDSGKTIRTEPDINVTAPTQKTKGNPVKPGQSWILDADLANINETWSLSEVKILNAVCPQNSPVAIF
jgi:flagellin-like protein